MAHETTLKHASEQACQLNSLLVAMNAAADDLDITDMNTLVTLALDLACDPACWLLEEQSLREANNAHDTGDMSASAAQQLTEQLSNLVNGE